MADAISRVTSGRKIGAFCMQHGPGTENAYGGVAQAFGESVPVLVMPGAIRAASRMSPPNYNAARADARRRQIRRADHVAAEVPQHHAPRLHATAQRPRRPVRWSRCRPTCSNEEIRRRSTTRRCGDPLGPDPGGRARSGAADPAQAEAAGDLCRHRASTGRSAWPQLRRWPSCSAAPVHHQPRRQERFPENHPLALGSGGDAHPKTVHHFLAAVRRHLRHRLQLHRDQSSAIAMPKGKTIIHATLDPDHLNKDVPAAIGLVGDAQLTLEALLGRARADACQRDRDATATCAHEIAEVREELARRVAAAAHFRRGAAHALSRDLGAAAHGRRANTIITHDAGSPRDQLSPFWVATEPLSYHRLGQDDAARLWASASRWARSWRSPTSSASTSGATPRSASPAWISRRRCASASRSCRSCSTTSRWRSS